MSSRTTYRKALKLAERELLKLINLQSETTRQIAQTRQTVLTLRMKLASNYPEYEIRAGQESYIPKTLTDACKNAIFGSKKPLDAHDVLDRVQAAGFEIKALNKLASVYSVLKRLTEQGLIEIVYMNVPGPENENRPMLWSRAYWPNTQHWPPPKGWRVFTQREIKEELAFMKKLGWATKQLNKEVGG